MTDTLKPGVCRHVTYILSSYTKHPTLLLVSSITLIITIHMRIWIIRQLFNIDNNQGSV